MSLTRSAVVTLAIATALVAALPAAADTGPAVGPDGGDEIVVTGGSHWERQQETIGPRRGRRRASPGSVVTYILDPQVRTNPATGQPCVFIGSIEGDPSSTAEAEAE